MILVVDIISYPEMCAEHGVPRSTSELAPSLSAFFIIFVSKYARARSTGRGADWKATQSKSLGNPGHSES